ncbi:unnamed protein product, partial [Nesidiocoris tenuis]
MCHSLVNYTVRNSLNPISATLIQISPSFAASARHYRTSPSGWQTSATQGNSRLK